MCLKEVFLRILRVILFALALFVFGRECGRFLRRVVIVDEASAGLCQLPGLILFLSAVSIQRPSE